MRSLCSPDTPDQNIFLLLIERISSREYRINKLQKAHYIILVEFFISFVSNDSDKVFGILLNIGNVVKTICIVVFNRIQEAVDRVACLAIESVRGFDYLSVRLDVTIYFM